MLNIYMYIYILFKILCCLWGFVFVVLIFFFRVMCLGFLLGGGVCVVHGMSGLTVPLAFCLFYTYIFSKNPFFKPRVIISRSLRFRLFNNISLSDDWHWSDLQ